MLKEHFNFVPEYFSPGVPSPAIAAAPTVAPTEAGKVSVSGAESLTVGAALQSQPSPRSEVSASVTKTLVTITSEPNGAEIHIDEQFDSSTPARLLLTPGEHIVKVLRPGFKPWERKITVEVGAEKTINAVLERLP